MDCSTPGFHVLHYLLEFAQTHVTEFWCDRTISSSVTLLLLLPSIVSTIRAFSNELALRIRWPKYYSFSINPSNEYSGLISFRIDWFDFPAVQGTLKSLLQHHSCITESISLHTHTHTHTHTFLRPGEEKVNYFSKTNRLGQVWMVRWVKLVVREGLDCEFGPSYFQHVSLTWSLSHF